MRAALTSGTTSGTSGSMRHALELSITTHPALAAWGAKCLLVPPPATSWNGHFGAVDSLDAVGSLDSLGSLGMASSPPSGVGDRAIAAIDPMERG